MEINYNVTGAARKTFAGAVSQELNAPVKYLGAPTFAYEVGGYHIDKNGVLSGEDNLDLVADLEGLHSFRAVSAKYDTPTTYEEGLGGLGALDEIPIPYEAELGGRVSPYRDFEEHPAYGNSEDEPGVLTIEMPLEGFTEKSIDNLEKIIASKANLIKKAIGASKLLVERTETTLRFPWFAFGLNSDEVAAYSQFIGALYAAAKDQKRVVAKEKSAPNEKFAFRVFLIRLGFVGDEYKTARRILLKNLSGNAAFKNGTPSKPEDKTDE